ncbi:Ig-like domain-containing protein [Leifsonia sp. NPDC058194]|uniref:Ig-like domain-containing protein n=1 Tax=Leifsonia sp. NPDC058194 TaxID=3346374 RepID=UPI0036D7EB20
MASQPASKTSLVTDFTETSSLVRVSGGATAAVCTNLTGRTVPQSLPFCATTKASAQVPHWTPGSFAPNVPEFPVTRFLWTGASTTDPAVPSTGELRVTVPAKYRDVSRQSQLTLKTAPDEAVQNGTDFRITVVDGAGKSFAVAASAVNPLAVNRMPGGTNTTLNKVVLQQLTIPTSTITGIDLTDVREVRLTAAVGADGTGTGGVYLSDLAFDTPSVGTAVVQTRTTVNVAPTTVEEGNGPGTADVAVYLNRAEKSAVTAYVSVIGTATGLVGIGMEKVAFAPGETCKAVTVPTLGNSAASASPSSAFKVSVTNSTNAVMGASAFANLTVREDDGVTGTVPALAPVGVQGDVCAELAAATTAVPLETLAGDVAPGGVFTLRATGYRAGETVSFRYGTTDLGTKVADADGTASVDVAIAEEADLGPADATATGSGSGRVATVTVSVLAPTETTLTASPEKPTAGEKVTFTATVTGQDTAGTVTFFDAGAPVDVLTPAPALSAKASTSAAVDADAPVVLGEVEIVDGVATLTLASGLSAGDHAVTASFARTATASASVSDPITVTVAPAASTGGPGAGGDGSSGSGSGTAATGSDALAATGSAIGLWLLAGLTVLLAGGGLVLVSRRRRTAE